MIAKTQEKIEIKKQDKKEKGSGQKREIVIPGETIVSGDDYLAGEGTRKEGKDIVALRFGLADKTDRLVKIIPLSGVYMPRRGNIIIGRITDITFNGWITDINAPYQSFLSVAECPKFINKNDLSEFCDINDIIVAKVWSVKRKGIDLTIKGRNLGKIEGGMIICINSNKVPRVIGKEGSMINLIKGASGCDITVGQNGVIWIKGPKVESELFAEKAIEFVTEKSFIGGLTEKTKEWLEKEKESQGKSGGKK